MQDSGRKNKYSFDFEYYMLKCNFIVTTFALAMMDKGQEKMVE
jgi:hypothetical protein